MSKFDELMQQTVNMEYSDLVGMAKVAIGNIYPICKEFDKDNEGAFLLISVILSAIATDGKLSAGEYSFLKDTLGLDDEKIATFLSMFDARMMELVDKFADALDVDGKASVLTLVTCVAACDQTISKEETAFIRKILA